MQPSDWGRGQPDGSPPLEHQHGARAGRESASSDHQPQPQPQEGTARQSPDLDATHSSLRAASTALEDALSRLQHIRNTLQDLEAQGLISNRSRPPPVQHSTRPASDDIGPSHSAIVLSDENDLATLDPEALRSRLDELGGTLPQYIRSAASIIRNITHRAASHLQDARVNNQVSSLRQTVDGLTSSWHPPILIPHRQAVDSPMSRSHTPHNQTSNAASGRYVRSRRNSNPFTEGVAVYRRQELANRDNDPSTSLGRRVASRTAAARSSENAPTDQRLRTSGSSRSTLSDHLYPPRALSGNSLTNRISVRSRMLHAPSRRVPQFEIDTGDRFGGDSDGSETEVDDALERFGIPSDSDDVGRRARERQRTDSGPLLPNLLPVSPISSPETANSVHSASTISSYGPVEEDRQAITTLRMREMRERLDRISSALAIMPGDRRGPLSLTNRALSGASSARPDADSNSGALSDNNNYRDVVDADEGRTYQIRRRINANGDEQVHRIRTDDWWSGEDDSDSVFPTGSSTIAGGRRSIPERLSDGVAWGQFPPQPVYEPPNVGSSSSGAPDVGRFSRRTSRYQVRQPSEASATAQSTATNNVPATTRRRRGWARINPDGDEIPTDEEEEVERVREQRLRNGQSVFNSAFPSSTRARLAYLPPTTRNAMSPWTDDGEDIGPTRIGLNLPTAQAHRRVQQLANSDQETSPLRSEKDTDQDMEYFGTSEAYYVCPLPTPLAQLSSAPVSAHRKSSRVKGLFVSRESELAAR